MSAKTIAIGGVMLAGLIWAGDKALPKRLLPSPDFPEGSTSYDCLPVPDDIAPLIPTALPRADKDALADLLTRGQVQDFRAFVELYAGLRVLPTTVSAGTVKGDRVQWAFPDGIAEFRYCGSGAVELIQVWR